MEITDQQLLTNWCTRRDANAFQAIVQRHAAMVFHTALRILNNPADAEDTTQQCFETLVTTQDTTHIQSLGAWLHGISTKLSLKHIRTTARRSQREERYAETLDTPDDTLQWNEIYPIIDEAIQTLDERYRTPIIAHFLAGQTHAQIARELNVSRSTITTRIDQGIKQTEALLKKKGIPATLALATTLTSLSTTKTVEASLIANLGKLALAQGQGIATATQTAVSGLAVSSTLKWVAAALIISTGATLGVWQFMRKTESPRPTAPAPVQAALALPQEIPATPEPTPAPPEITLAANTVQEPEASTTPEAPATLETETQPSPPANIVHVSGIVTDAAGNPVPAAKVDALWLSGEADTIADEQGRFSFPLHKNTFADGELVIVRKVDYQNSEYDIPIRIQVDGDTLLGYLDTPIGEFPLIGERTSEEGEGAFGVWEVFTTFQNEDHPGVFTLIQDPDGTVYGTWEDDLGPPELASLTVPDQIRLSAASENKKAFEHDYDVPVDGRDNITLALVTPATVHGQIIDSEGTPLSEWGITLSNGDQYAGAKSDANGNFTVTDINPGEYRYSAYNSKLNVNIRESDTITLADAEVLQGLTLVYELGQIMTGYVTDTENQPVEGVRITAILSTRETDSNGGLTAYHAQTDANGAYELSGIPNLPDTKLDFQMSHQDYMQEQEPNILVDGSTHNFTMTKLPKIEGRVVDANTNSPITKYRIYAMTGGDSDEKLRLFIATGYELTDHEDGTFTTRSRSGYGNIGIVATAPGFATTLHRLTNVQPGETRSDITIPLEPVEPIKGKVVDANGDPVRGARIFLGSPPIISGRFAGSVIGADGIARTTRKGTFTITEYPPAHLDQIAAHADGYAPVWANISPPYENIQLVLVKGSELEGTVTHMGNPVGSAQATIGLTVKDRTIMHRYSEDNGGYTFDMIPDLPVTLTATYTHNGQFMNLSRPVTQTTENTDPHNFDFDTSGTAFIEGTLLLDDYPPKQALIFATAILQNGDEILYRAVTAADGSYKIGPIHAGTYEFGPRWIQLEDGSYLTPDMETITIPPNQTTQHNILLTTK